MRPVATTRDVQLAALQDRLWFFAGVAIVSTILTFGIGYLGEHLGFRLGGFFVGFGCFSAAMALLLWASMMGVDIVRVVSLRRYRTAGRLLFTFLLEVPFGCFVVVFAAILVMAGLKHL